MTFVGRTALSVEINTAGFHALLQRCPRDCARSEHVVAQALLILLSTHRHVLVAAAWSGLTAVLDNSRESRASLVPSRARNKLHATACLLKFPIDVVKAELRVVQQYQTSGTLRDDLADTTRSDGAPAR